MSQCRPSNRRETRRDAAHRRSAVRAAYARRHSPSTRPRRDPPFCSSELPHGLTSQCRPNQSTRDAPRRSPPTIRHAPPPAPPAATHHNHAPDATPTSTQASTKPTPLTRPRPLASEHGGGAPDEPPPHARPSDRRADTPVHSAAPVAAPRPCTLQPHPCAGARPRRSARLSRVLRAPRPSGRGLRPSCDSCDSVSQTFTASWC
jgi:hypothetical protein